MANTIFTLETPMAQLQGEAMLTSIKVSGTTVQPKPAPIPTPTGPTGVR